MLTEAALHIQRTTVPSFDSSSVERLVMLLFFLFFSTVKDLHEQLILIMSLDKGFLRRATRPWTSIISFNSNTPHVVPGKAEGRANSLSSSFMGWILHGLFNIELHQYSASLILM